MLNKGDKVIATKDIVVYDDVFIAIGMVGEITDYDTHGGGHVEVLWANGELTCARLGYNVKQ